MEQDIQNSINLVNKRKCRLDASVSNNKQRWKEDKCRCDCK